jgi:hypothetical protein
MIYIPSAKGESSIFSPAGKNLLAGGRVVEYEAKRKIEVINKFIFRYHQIITLTDWYF